MEAAEGRWRSCCCCWNGKGKSSRLAFRMVTKHGGAQKDLMIPAAAHKCKHTVPSGHEAESRQIPPTSFCEKPSKHVQLATATDALGDSEFMGQLRHAAEPAGPY